MRLGPLSDDNTYFMNGGVSIRVSRGDTIWQPNGEEQPEPWICHYCGSSNPGDVWHCTHCPAPRSEVTREEKSTWLLPTQVISHIEEEPHVDLPPAPWWIAILTILLFVFSFVTGIGTFSAILFTGNPLSVVLWTAAFVVCFYVFGKLRKVVHDRYDYEIVDWDIG